MQRYGQVIGIKPQHAAEYERFEFDETRFHLPPLRTPFELPWLEPVTERGINLCKAVEQVS